MDSATDDDDFTGSATIPVSSLGSTVLVPADEETLAIGALAGNYVIEKVIGEGGGGIVYLAQHRVLRRRAALKVLRRCLANSPNMTARFVREASAVHRIGHTNIVDVYEFGELEDGRPFYVMELMEGTDLRQLLLLKGRFTPSEALDVLEPACLALIAAHEAGVVHRDLKASNVLVTEKHGERVVKLVDFGVAKLLHPDPSEAGLTAPGSVLGSLHTMSPEQILCEAIDTRTDVYALGILLFQILTGTLPFTGSRGDVAGMHMHAKRPRPSERAPVPPALDAVVLRAMERKKDQRYQSVRAFLDDFRRAVRGDDAGDGMSSDGAAVGICLELRTQDGDVDDAMLDDMTNILDLCEGALRAEGFAVPLQTSNVLLGVKPLSREPDKQRSECDQSRELAHTLLEQLVGRDLADPRVRPNLGIHVAEAVFRNSADGLEVTGGPILQIENWVPQRDLDELFLSEEFQQSMR